MQPQQTEKKAPPPVEVSLNYLSWTAKDSVKAQIATQEMLSRTLSHMCDTLDKILIAVTQRAPF
jgi:hypothetical protein